MFGFRQIAIFSWFKFILLRYKNFFLRIDVSNVHWDVWLSNITECHLKKHKKLSLKTHLMEVDCRRPVFIWIPPVLKAWASQVAQW